jgi:hypothetical protein
MSRPIRELDDAAKLYRELAKDATQANKFKIAKALKEIGLAKLNHKRTIIIHRNCEAPYDPATDLEPDGNPNDAYSRPTAEERRKWEAWKKRQDNYYAAHPEVPRP